MSVSISVLVPIPATLFASVSPSVARAVPVSVPACPGKFWERGDNWKGN